MPVIVGWFDQDGDKSGTIFRGRYEITEDRLFFSTTSSAGVVDYNGSIDGNTLILDSHSQINDHRGQRTYRWMAW